MTDNKDSRRLLSDFFAGDDTLQIEDVPDGDVALRIHGEHDERGPYSFGVVIKDVPSLPDAVEVRDQGVVLPRDVVDGVNLPGSDEATLFAYRTEDDDALYAGVVCDRIPPDLLDFYRSEGTIPVSGLVPRSGPTCLLWKLHPEHVDNVIPMMRDLYVSTQL